MSKKKYNPEIDLLKFLFSIIIVLYHSKYIFAIDSEAPLPYGFTCVEFFFIISGYLMVKSSKKFDSLQVGKSTANFLIGKLKTIYPYFLFSLITAFTVRQITFFLNKDYTIINLCKDAVQAIAEALLQLKTGIEYGTVYNGPTWYICAMIIAMAVLFPVLLKHRDWFVNVGSLLIAIFGYAICYQTKGTVNYLDWSGFTTMAIIRAVSAISLGCFVAAMVERVESAGISLKKTGKILLWLVEIALISLIIVIMQCVGDVGFNYITVILFVFLCFIVLSGLTGVQNILPAKLCSFLGKCSLLFYLNHRYVARLINLVAPETTYLKAMIAYVVVTAIMAAVSEIVVTTVKKLWTKFSPKVKNLIFE